MKVCIVALLVCGTLLAQGRRATRSGGGGALPRPSLDTAAHPTMTGELKGLTKKLFFVADENGNQTKFHVTGKTAVFDLEKKKIKLTDLHDGEQVSVEMALAVDGSYDAISVHLESGQSQEHIELKTRPESSPQASSQPAPQSAPQQP